MKNQYSKEELVNSTLEELRQIAEELKLQECFNLKKEYLIEEIIKCLQGEKKLVEKANIKIENPETDYIAEGTLELMQDGYGFLRGENYLPGSKDIYMSPVQIKRFGLDTGDRIKGIARFISESSNNKFPSLIYVDEINGEPIEKALRRKPFDKLVPIYPTEKIILETKNSKISTRLIDLIAPIGKGQRGMIVAPPKAGKTTLLKQIANSITENNPDCHLIVLLIDERPEEVTDMQRTIKGEVIYSTFDEAPENHIRVTKMVLGRAKKLVEQEKDVIILMDSLTRLTRANNISISPSGRTLTGGLDPACLHLPKKFFGAARNIEGGGSLTILATALIDTGSRMDDVIFEEFKGTGNMEIHLDRRLSEKRIYPSIEILKSGTRKDDLLLTKEQILAATMIRKTISKNNNQETIERIVDMLGKTSTNEEFVKKISE
ncbi:MAG: transcription termination factor Rho [Clostridia bacterium]